MNIYNITYNSHLYDGSKTIVKCIVVASNKIIAKALFINDDRLGKLRYANDGIINIVKQ